MPEKKHANDDHPAVGLLDCVRLVNNKKFETAARENPNCRHCGFDKAWHELKPSDYTGGTRDQYWQQVADRTAAQPKMAFEEAAPKFEENPEPNSEMDMNAIRADLVTIRREAEAQAKRIVEGAQAIADQQLKAIAAEIAASVRESMNASAKDAKADTTKHKGA